MKKQNPFTGQWKHCFTLGDLVSIIMTGSPVFIYADGHVDTRGVEVIAADGGTANGLKVKIWFRDDRNCTKIT